MDAFHDTSVAIQGFPALERVMFDDGMIDGAEGRFRCALSAAITENIAGIAEAILTEWTERDTGPQGNRELGPVRQRYLP